MSSRDRDVSRRQVLKAGVTLSAVGAVGAAGAAAAVVGCNTATPAPTQQQPAPTRTKEVIQSVKPLGFPWRTRDPFLFCAYHRDTYPAANERMGPAASLAGRNLGRDFTLKDGWRMYHGEQVPGFPQHPHRGFETVTVVRKGLVDHADSLGATARYGQGDTQWMTAGRGIVHAEMFPLLDQSAANPLELFQVWLNLPAGDKMVEPHFKMLWSREIPRHTIIDAAGHSTVVTVVAGAIADAKAPAPPPKSWAARADSDVAIWTIDMQPGASMTLPAAQAGSNRTLYLFRGAGLTLAGRQLSSPVGIELVADAAVQLKAGPERTQLLMLQGRPIGEPVARRGPFVMNTEAEIQRAYQDYRRTRFGGWPWPDAAPVHDRNEPRFAKHVDGKVEKAG